MVTTVLNLTLFVSPSQADYTPDFLTEANCLATNIYFEARGETVKGQIAVAMVTINRVNDARFPDTICDVVHEGKINSKGRPIHGLCQFSWYCDNRSDKIPVDSAEARLAMAIAVTVMTTPLSDITSGALYFHSQKVKTHKRSENIIEIGNHVFYGGS